MKAKARISEISANPKRPRVGAWKDCEREFARLVHGRRIGILGKADVETDGWSFEVKARKKTPAFMARSMAQAVSGVRGDRRPAVIVHQKNDSYSAALVVLRLEDFLAMEREKDAE